MNENEQAFYDKGRADLAKEINNILEEEPLVRNFLIKAIGLIKEIIENNE